MTAPAWVAILPDNALVSASELAKWIGIAEGSISYELQKGLLPKPSVAVFRLSKLARRWRVGDVRRWLKTQIVEAVKFERVIGRANSIIAAECHVCKKAIDHAVHASRYCGDCRTIACEEGRKRSRKKAKSKRKPATFKARRGPSERKYNKPTDEAIQ